MAVSEAAWLSRDCAQGSQAWFEASAVPAEICIQDLAEVFSFSWNSLNGLYRALVFSLPLSFLRVGNENEHSQLWPFELHPFPASFLISSMIKICLNSLFSTSS